nr:hypothetical protein [uncultured Prevotella sp.]
MKHELIMSGLLILGNPMLTHAQQTKTTTAGSSSTESCSTENILTKMEGLLQDSIQAMKEKLRQDSIQWEKQLAAVTIKGTRSQVR